MLHGAERIRGGGVKNVQNYTQKICIERRFYAGSSSDLPLQIRSLKKTKQNPKTNQSKPRKTTKENTQTKLEKNNKTRKKKPTKNTKTKKQRPQKTLNCGLLKACHESQQYSSKVALHYIFSKYERMKFDQCFYRIGMHIYFCFGKFGSFPKRIPFAWLISTVGVGR